MENVKHQGTLIGYNDLGLTDLHRRVLDDLTNSLNYYKMLYRLTSHSKKKEKHMYFVKWLEEVIEDYVKECMEYRVIPPVRKENG